MDKYLVAAFYKFAALPDFEDWREPLLECCVNNDVRGSLLLAPEGINGTLAGSAEGIQRVLALLRADERFAGLKTKESTATSPPFQRMKVRLKREIVTMGVPAIDPNEIVGTYVAPEDWNALLEDPDVIVVDARNDYEVAIGSFKGARNPAIKTFREFPRWLLGEIEAKEQPKVAMFCTGGIRCEKSTAFLKQAGVEEVFHLEGGILKYLENVPEEESLWEGECFVFDQRVSVCHGLREGSYELCHACGDPVGVEDKLKPDFIEGVQCRGCIERTTPLQKEKFAARFAQLELAKSRAKANKREEL